MTKHTMWLGLTMSLVGCAAPKPAIERPPTDIEPLKQELAQLKDTLAHLDLRLGHLEGEVSASSAENELTTMTIVSVGWSTDDERLKNVQRDPVLVCHVAEWRGYGKMLRFTRMADRCFFLDADNLPSVVAFMDTGGGCNSDGSWRFVALRPSEALDPTVRYHLRAENTNERYRWSVPADLVVSGPEPKR